MGIRRQSKCSSGGGRCSCHNDGTGCGSCCGGDRSLQYPCLPPASHGSACRRQTRNIPMPLRPCKLSRAQMHTRATDTREPLLPLKLPFSESSLAACGCRGQSKQHHLSKSKRRKHACARVSVETRFPPACSFCSHRLVRCCRRQRQLRMHIRTQLLETSAAPAGSIDDGNCPSRPQRQSTKCFCLPVGRNIPQRRRSAGGPGLQKERMERSD